MKINKTIVSFFIITIFATCSFSLNIDFPSSYKDGVLYFKKDRGDITEDIFVDKDVIKKVQAGKSIPVGTVITLVEYYAKDKKGADGYALKGDLKRYVVMKRGARDNSSGGWEYKVFNPDKSVNHSENPSRCKSCHASQKNNEFVFTYEQIKSYNLN